MFVADLDKKIIHDAMNSKYECHIKDIPKDNSKRIYSIQTVKRMMSAEHRPQFNGCQYCMSEYHTFDFTSIFHK